MGSRPSNAAGSPQLQSEMKSSKVWLSHIASVLLLTGVLCQDEEQLSQEKKLCEDKSSGELFRLKAGKDSCRDVIQCTAAGLQAIRCPPGLAFDLEKQTCDWKWAVKNCEKLTKEKKVKPLLVTDEPLCEDNKLACDDAINNNNIDLYTEIFNKQRRNPNGCDIKGTFYVSHKYTNYSAVQNMHRLGHEIAAHSITHNDDESFWSEAGTEDWAREMAGSRLIIEKFSPITDNV